MNLCERYRQDGIWTMDTPRNTCVVPEKPLIISEREEVVFNRLALAAWNALGSVVDNINNAPLPFQRVADAAKPFPDGMTLPPAIRIDTVRTADGPRIVEIDPVTAISLGETAALIRLWQEQGYAVPDGLVDTIVASLPADDARMAVDLPSAKSEYAPEIDFLVQQLKNRGVELSDDGIQLSAFNDVPAIRRRINREGWEGSANPLWGSLIGLNDKTNLGVLISGDKARLPEFLPITYSQEELDALDPDAPLVAKPERGTGSTGVKLVTAKEAANLPKGNIYQEVLEPLTDDFGLKDAFVSRVSIYAGRYGLLGAQVTARRREPGFTNVHGQDDAIQTTLAVVPDTALELAINR